MNTASTEQPLRLKTKPFSEAHTARSLIEVCISLILYGLIVYAIYFTYQSALWSIYLPLVLLGSLVMVKIFTLFHDCTHQSLFNSVALNIWCGRFLSLFVTVPYAAWKIEHDDHHSHVVDVERLKHGDILLWTVLQYRQTSKLWQLFYRTFRHPLFLLLFSPILYFFVKTRFPTQSNDKHFWSIILTNFAVCAVFVPIVYYFGFWTTVFVLGLPAYLSGLIGIALFYLQHDYPDAEWFTTAEWQFEKAALHGSSLMILPQPLEWFTHAIGYHHIHHLNSKIPGYRLRACYEATPEFQTATALTWADVLAAFRLKLWSYDQNRLVTFEEYPNVRN